MSSPQPPPHPHVRVADVPATDFTCSYTHDGLDAAWVHVAGELDMATTPELAEALDEARKQARLVVLDLRDLQFVDSSGVHAIVNASIGARQVGRRLVVVRGPASVDRVFDLTGISGDIEIGDLAPGEPPVQVLLQLAKQDDSS